MTDVMVMREKREHTAGGGDKNNTLSFFLIID